MPRYYHFFPSYLLLLLATLASFLSLSQDGGCSRDGYYHYYGVLGIPLTESVSFLESYKEFPYYEMTRPLLIKGVLGYNAQLKVIGAQLFPEDAGDDYSLRMELKIHAGATVIVQDCVLERPLELFVENPESVTADTSFCTTATSSDVPAAEGQPPPPVTIVLRNVIVRSTRASTARGITLSPWVCPTNPEQTSVQLQKYPEIHFNLSRVDAAAVCTADCATTNMQTASSSSTGGNPNYAIAIQEGQPGTPTSAAAYSHARSMMSFFFSEWNRFNVTERDAVIDPATTPQYRTYSMAVFIPSNALIKTVRSFNTTIIARCGQKLNQCWGFYILSHVLNPPLGTAAYPGVDLLLDHTSVFVHNSGVTLSNSRGVICAFTGAKIIRAHLTNTIGQFHNEKLEVDIDTNVIQVLVDTPPTYASIEDFSTTPAEYINQTNLHLHGTAIDPKYTVAVVNASATRTFKDNPGGEMILLRPNLTNVDHALFQNMSVIVDEGGFVEFHEVAAISIFEVVNVRTIVISEVYIECMVRCQDEDAVYVYNKYVELDFLLVEKARFIRRNVDTSNGIVLNSRFKPSTVIVIREVEALHLPSAVPVPILNGATNFCNQTHALTVSLIGVRNLTISNVTLKAAGGCVALFSGMMIGMVAQRIVPSADTHVVIEHTVFELTNSGGIAVPLMLMQCEVYSDRNSALYGLPDLRGSAVDASMMARFGRVTLRHNRWNMDLGTPANGFDKVRCMITMSRNSVRHIIFEDEEYSESNGVICPYLMPGNPPQVSHPVVEKAEFRYPCSRITTTTTGGFFVIDSKKIAQEQLQRLPIAAGYYGATVTVNNVVVTCMHKPKLTYTPTLPATLSRPSLSVSQSAETLSALDPSASKTLSAATATLRYRRPKVVAATPAQRAAVATLGMLSGSSGSVNMARKALGIYRLASCGEQDPLGDDFVDTASSSLASSSSVGSSSSDTTSASDPPIIPLTFDSHPFGFTIGNDDDYFGALGSLRGAQIGNLVFVLVWLGVMLVAAGIRWKWFNNNNSGDASLVKRDATRRRTNSNSAGDVGGESDSENLIATQEHVHQEEPDSFSTILAEMFFPSLAVVAVNILGPPTVQAATTLAVVGSSSRRSSSSSKSVDDGGGGDIFYVTVGLLCFLVFPLAAFIWTAYRVSNNPETLLTEEETEAEREKNIRALMMAKGSVANKKTRNGRSRAATSANTAVNVTGDDNDDGGGGFLGQLKNPFVRLWIYFMIVFREWKQTDFFMRYGVMFDSYSSVYFALAEYVCVSVIASASGVAELCQGTGCCFAWSSICLVTCVVYLASIVLLRPFINRFDWVFITLTAVLLLLMSILVLCALSGLSGVMSVLLLLTEITFYIGIFSAVVYVLDAVVVPMLESAVGKAVLKSMRLRKRPWWFPSFAPLKKMFGGDDDEHDDGSIEHDRRGGGMKSGRSRSRQFTHHRQQLQDVLLSEEDVSFYSDQDNDDLLFHHQKRAKGGPGAPAASVNTPPISTREDLLFTVRGRTVPAPSSSRAAPSQDALGSRNFSFGRLNDRNAIMQRFQELQSDSSVSHSNNYHKENTFAPRHGAPHQHQQPPRRRYSCDDDDDYDRHAASSRRRRGGGKFDESDATPFSSSSAHFSVEMKELHDRSRSNPRDTQRDRDQRRHPHRDQRRMHQQPVEESCYSSSPSHRDADRRQSGGGGGGDRRGERRGPTATTASATFSSSPRFASSSPAGSHHSSPRSPTRTAVRSGSRSARR